MEPKEYFYDHYYPLSEEFILKFSKDDRMLPINNVVVSMERHCFGLTSADEAADELSCRLFYINGQIKLQGDSITLSVKNPDWDVIVFLFAKFISDKYEDIDAIEVFNTFQAYTRTFLEKLEYLTYVPKHEGHHTIIAKGVKGLIPIHIINKKEFYIKFFGEKTLVKPNADENFIYLMLNSRNSLVKIGRSKSPQFREKTLQAEEPEIAIYCVVESALTN